MYILINPTTICNESTMKSINYEADKNDYQMSCHFAEQLKSKEKLQRYIARSYISDFADLQPYFSIRFPNLWNEIRTDIFNIAIDQPVSMQVIMGAGYTLQTAIRYMETNQTKMEQAACKN
jgi:long-subunit acyl-CoA synthetase (AMP-forming)